VLVGKNKRKPKVKKEVTPEIMIMKAYRSPGNYIYSGKVERLEKVREIEKRKL